MEIIENEYHVSYLQKLIEPGLSGIINNTNDFSVGSIVAKPTVLRGVKLVDWLQEIIAELIDADKDEITILAISEVGSWVVEVD